MQVLRYRVPHQSLHGRLKRGERHHRQVRQDVGLRIGTRLPHQPRLRLKNAAQIGGDERRPMTGHRVLAGHCLHTFAFSFLTPQVLGSRHWIRADCRLARPEEASL
jgi:hypothetical protein